MDSFYITLPSNCSTDIYPSNTPEHFKTVLPRRIGLQGDYEVALTEIHYPQFLYNINKDIHYIRIEFAQENKEGEKVIGRYDFRLLDAVYLSVEQLVLHINSLSKEGVLKYRFDIGKDKIVSFRTEYIDTKLEMSDSLALMLGFIPGMRFLRQERAQSPPNLMLGLPKNIYVYTDFVHPQFVGDVMARLLRVVKVDIKRFQFGGISTEYFHNPQYVPVARNELQEVEIDIRDDLGKPAIFLTGSTTVVLHFRKR